jgi:hypothetical protein
MRDGGYKTMSARVMTFNPVDSVQRTKKKGPH